MKSLIIRLALVLLLYVLFSNNTYALTPEQGQQIFDDLFYPIIGFFSVSIMIGLFIKIINRS
jgi:hypothetical protein